MATGISGYQRPRGIPGAGGAQGAPPAASAGPETPGPSAGPGERATSTASVGREAAKARTPAGEPGGRPEGQAGARGGWQVPDCPASAMSARDLRAMQKERQDRARAGRRRVRLLASAGAAILCLAAASVLVYTGKLPGRIGVGSSGPSVPKQGPMYSLDPFIVNVAGTNGTRYLKAALSVECVDRKVSSDMAKAEYMVRDAILEVLSAQTLGDLTDISRRDAIRQQVADAIERTLSGGKREPARVKGIYFIEFVIQ